MSLHNLVIARCLQLAILVLITAGSGSSAGQGSTDRSSDTPTPTGSADPKGCIPSGDETAINAALSGLGAKASLCPRAIFEISRTIKLSADGQELTTAGPVAEADRAVIRLANSDLSTAIFSRSSDIFIHDLIVDGARPQFGRMTNGSALIELGGKVKGVRVDHIHAYDPRGWSVLHVYEGSLQCTGARITNSVLGPAGHPDGEWADGISFACRNGLVSQNTIVDASDGAIVLFGAPGTVVEGNLIKTENNQLLGGINLVDYGPFDGDYSGTVVRHNRIVADKGFIKVGIAVGPAVWGSNKGQVNRNGVVVDNMISGNHIGFGIAVDGVTGFTITGNKVLGRPGGQRGPRCIKGQSPPGKALIRNPETTQGNFQDGFETGSLLYSICIVP